MNGRDERSFSAQKPRPAPRETHPWLRLLGRAIDMGLLIALAGILLGVLKARSVGPWVLYLYIWALSLLWIPLEALLLCYWGSTPGKWMVANSVRDAYGMRLPYHLALRRSLAVWLLGLGAGIVPLTLVAMALSYSYLVREGQTPWDERGRWHVAHGAIGPLQLVLLVLAVCMAAALAVGLLVMLLMGPVRRWP